MKVDPTVRRETLYIAACVLVLSVVMELVFLALQMWDVSVLWGNLLGGAAAVLNYFLMGLTIQHAVGMDAKHAASKMHVSQALRMLMILLVGILGIALPAFHVVALLVPLFFPRIASMFRPLFKGLDERKEDV